MEAPTLADSRRLPRSLAITLAVALVIALLGAAPADARSSWQYRETGRAASTDWVQVDGTPTGTSPFGNVHVGYLTAYETTTGRAAAWGSIEDWDCEEGQEPGWGGHDVDDEEPEPDGCLWKGSRWLEGEGLLFSMDKKMTTAKLQGQLTAFGGGHGEETAVGFPMADIVWTGTGGTYSSRYTTRYRDGDTTWTETWRSTDRSATMSGTLGPMGFDPDRSSGYLSSYSTSSKGRTK